MVKKLGIAVIVVGGLAYVGGSYYVGHRAEQMLSEMMANAQAQSNDAIQWEGLQKSHGIFSSTGSVTMVYQGIELADGQPAKVDIDYTIHHALGFSHIAHFLWSATPTGELAQALTPVYTTAPSITGDGHMFWSGQTTSSIDFPGVNNAQIDTIDLSFAPVVGEVTSRKNEFDLSLAIDDVQIADREDGSSLQMTGLGYRAHSTDLSRSAAVVEFHLAQAQGVDEFGQTQSLRDYQWLLEFAFDDDVLDFQSKKSIAAIRAFQSGVDNFQWDLAIDGLTRDDLRALAAIDNVGVTSAGELTEAQQEALAPVLASMLSKGLSIRMPVLRGDLQLIGSDVPEALEVKDFQLDLQSGDLEFGAGHFNLSLGALSVPQAWTFFVPQIQGLALSVRNEIVDERAVLELVKQLERFEQAGQSISGVDLQVKVAGVAAESLNELAELLWASGGDPDQLSAPDADRLAEIVQDAIAHGLSVEVPVLTASAMLFSDQPDTIDLQRFGLRAQLDDVQAGAGRFEVSLDSLSASGPMTAGIPQVQGFALMIDNAVTDGRSAYTLQKSAKAFKSDWVDIQDFELEMRLNGLLAEDVAQVAALIQRGGQAMSLAEHAQTMQALRRAIDHGFELQVPTWKVSLDDARLDGQAELVIAPLGGAPLASFDLSRLATIGIVLELDGQSALITPFIEAGAAMGMVTIDGDQAQAQLQFVNGQLELNGESIPADEFVMMGNMMIQQLLANTQ